MKKRAILFSFISLMALSPMFYAANAATKPQVQSTDKAELTEFYRHEIATPIASPEPLWWPAWKDAIERERKIELKENNGAIKTYDKKAQPVFIKLKDGEYQYFYISYGPIWRDGDLELMASVINYNKDYCDEMPNSSTNTDPFEHCNGSVTARNVTTGEVKTFKTVKKVCNAGEPFLGSTAKTTVELDRKTKTITFNGVSKGKSFPGCKVSVKYQ